MWSEARDGPREVIRRVASLIASPPQGIGGLQISTSITGSTPRFIACDHQNIPQSVIPSAPSPISSVFTRHIMLRWQWLPARVSRMQETNDSLFGNRSRPGDGAAGRASNRGYFQGSPLSFSTHSRTMCPARRHWFRHCPSSSPRSSARPLLSEFHPTSSTPKSCVF